MTEQTPEKPVLKRYTIARAETLTLGQMMGIKAATGIDVMDPPSYAAGMAAMIWYAGRGDQLPFEVAMQYTVDDFDVEDEPDLAQPDDALAPEAEDPTPGSDTPPVS